VRRALLAAVVLSTGGAAQAKAPPHETHVLRVARPAPPLPFLPVIARIRAEVAHDRAVVTHDLVVPRGEYTSRDLDLFVAFGAPGAPKAFDARIFPASAGSEEPVPDDAGDAVPTERAPHRPVSAELLLGRPNQAGAVLHLREASLQRAFAPGDTAIVRVRSLHDLPEEDSRGARELVVRLGDPGDQPVALERIELVSLEPRPWIQRAEVRLCGPDADAHPLSLLVNPRPPGPADRSLVSPVLALRHASDDLCLTFWSGR
jgi:hypothetical protein